MANLAVLRIMTTEARQKVERRKGEHSTLKTRRDELVAAHAESLERIQIISNTAVLLREAADYAREQARTQVQELTSSALQSVFGGTYGFRLESDTLGNRPAIWCRTQTPYGDDDTLETEGADSRGGGVTDVQALALRWAMLETHRPQIEGPLLLDEPAKHVSEENVPAAGSFLRSACQQFERQVIMVTHNNHLAELADKVHQVVLVDGASRVA